MTVIDVTAAVTAIGGRAAVQDGSVLIEYLYGEDGTPSTRTDGSTALLSHAIRVPIVGGVPAFPVDVPPTDGKCYARITVAAVKPYAPTPLVLPAVAIPTTGPVAISALVAVDRASYQPTTDVVTAWTLVVDQVAAMQSDVTAKSAQAVEAAADAGTFAGATEFDADRAGQSAFAAGQSAESALGHKNDAKTSADAAAGSASSAAGSVVSASTERQGAADERFGARQERLDAQTARAGAETAQSGAQTARTGSEAAKTAAELARDQAQAATFAGTTPAAGTSLDTLTNTGMYRISWGATVAQGAPFDNFYGSLRVEARATGAVTQVARKHNALSADASQFWQRTQTGGGWGAWFAYSAALWEADGTRGRTLKMWDPINGRYSLVYADTGMRDITALLGPLWDAASTLFVRRRLHVITWYFNLRPKAALAGSTQHAVFATGTTLPAGFENVGGGPAFDTFLSAVGVPAVQPWMFNRTGPANGGSVAPAIYPEAGQVPALTWLRGTVQHDTASPWPTALPGSASGTIPSA